MAITVVLPNALRPYAAGNDRVALEAGTVVEALTKLTERYADLKNRFPLDQAAMPAGSGIYRNGLDIRRLQGLDTPLRNDDLLTLIVPSGDL